MISLSIDCVIGEGCAQRLKSQRFTCVLQLQSFGSFLAFLILVCKPLIMSFLSNTEQMGYLIFALEQNTLVDSLFGFDVMFAAPIALLVLLVHISLLCVPL